MIARSQVLRIAAKALLVFAALGAAAPREAGAQQTKPAATKAAPPGKSAAKGGAKDSAKTTPASSSEGGAHQDAGAAGAAPRAAVGGGEKTASGARVFRFGELEIEGRLKTPQLVYFLRRVRAEFETPNLGHRSFIPELSETRNDSHFK